MNVNCLNIEFSNLHGPIPDDMNEVDRAPVQVSRSLGSNLQPNYALDDELHMIAMVSILDSL